MLARNERPPRAMRYKRALALLLVPLAWVFVHAPGRPSVRAAGKDPIYVGSHACAKCHDGAGMGHQYSKWLLGRHARAYASLSLPESRQISDLSGIPGDPHDSPMCLGCHATGSDAEPWQRDAAFHTADGVQCEKCHGPGSEYMDMEVMQNREAAMMAGLMMPAKKDCMLCHYVKGSHAAVHKRPLIDVEKAWMKIAHPTPKSASPGGPAGVGKTVSLKGPKYAGVDACGACHNTAMMNRQANRWKMTAHSRAWAVLATPKAFEIAKDKGLTGAPQQTAQCLKCHATGHGQDPGRFLASARITEGVTCEACHGPGSEYMPEAVMRDRLAARKAGLVEPTAESCMGCHQNAHGKTFDAVMAMKKIAHPMKPPMATMAKTAEFSIPPSRSGYKTPRHLAVRPDGAEVWIACEASDSLIIVDVKKRLKTAEIKVGGQPHDVAFEPDGKRAFVSNRLDDSVSAIDVACRKVTATIAVGDEPHGLVVNKSGALLFVLNSASEDISVIDLEELRELRRLKASRFPWSLALSPDGRRIVATNTLSKLVPFRQPSVSELTVIDAEKGRIADRLEAPGANLLQGVDWHPSGRFALFTLNRTKNLVPMTRIHQGWTITNGLGVAWADGRVDQVLLDEPNWYFADASDVAITPDGRLAFATSQGTNRVAVVDVERLIDLLQKASLRDRAEVIPNHLGKSAEFIVNYVETPDAPRGVAVTPDGTTAFVANQLDDSLTVIDVGSRASVARIDLGGPREVTHTRWGEKLFHSANITFQRQFACASCHPDGHVDGLTYDIEADGIGINPVDNRTLRGIYDTDPFKWEGTNPSLARQCGARLAAYFTRIQPFTPEELSAVNDYTVTIPRPPNRYRAAGAELTAAQARGKLVFERTHGADGKEIPVDNRCITCHFPPYYTDRSKRDVGSKHWLDKQGIFDVPHLNNIYDSAPYLHNGIADTLEEIWTRFNPYDTHGVTNDMTKDQLNDLIEYLKTL
ncbi:MAG: beta-propeller fold lactonase family protein [Vicinamibacteria bacterium]|nr:beta-propeller fold lactonase family protein [Vicinamibacteria bacterium]